ncbi:uncharacterized protein LOC144650558 [Oculina patagonica]
MAANAAFSQGVHVSKLDQQPETCLSHGPKESAVRKRCLYGPSLVPNVTGFSQGVIPPGSSVERHVHVSKYETFYCLNGRGKIIVGRCESPSDEDLDVEIEAGSCVTLAPQFWHSVHNTASDEDLILLYFGVAV